jgi:hypothetical protein
MQSALSLRAAKRSSGSAFIVALLMLMVLSLVGATVLMTVSTRYNYTQKAIGWDEALAAAEAGADYGMTNCRRTLPTSTINPWIGWQKYTGAYTWAPVSSSADATTQLAAGNTLIYNLPAASHLISTGEGATEFWYHVEVDAPSFLVVNGNQWYRIRSTGYAALPGLARAGNDNPSGARTHNDILRKLDLRFDHFIMRYGDYAHAAGSAIPVSPQATRRVEEIARPTTPFNLAAFTASTTGSPLNLSLIDSFDSRDTVNYPGGLYSSAARNPATGVGSKGSIYINAPVSSLSTTVYGDVSTNYGTLAAASNIIGQVENQETINVPVVTAPAWAASVVSSPATTLVAGPPSTPVYQSWSSIDNLSVTLPSGSSTGVAYIYVSGNITGGITTAPGVTLKVWFGGNLSMKTHKIVNGSNNAANLQLYGITPPLGLSRTVSLTGSDNPDLLYLLLDCPAYDATIASNPDICGAIVANSITATGSANLHYDEALSVVGDPVDFERAMWVEDAR